MSSELYGHSISLCFPVQNFTEIRHSGADLWSTNNLKMAANRHLEYWKFSHLVIWLSSSSKCAFGTKFPQKRVIFHWDVAISWFLKWTISAILNFRGPTMGSLKRPYRTSCKLSIENIALKCTAFEKIAFFVLRIFATERQKDGQTDEQMHSPDALRRSRRT